MKPTVLTLLTLFGNSDRRRKLLSALIAGLLFIVGAPSTKAAPVGRVSKFDNVSITIIKDYSVVNDQPDIIKVHIDPAPNPGEDITFNISKFGYTPLVTTDINGDAILSFKGTIVGPVDVDIIRNGVTITTVTVTFIAAPGPVDPAKSYLTVLHSPEIANGTNQDIVLAHVVDIYGNLMYSTPVNFEIVSGTASFVAGPTVPTGAKGTANAGEAQSTQVSTVVGSVDIKAKVNGVYINGGNFVTVQFIVGPVDLSKSYIEVVQSPQPADGTSEDIVRVHLFDSYGHPLPDSLVTFSILTGTANFSTASSGTTNAAGTIDAKLVSTTVGSVKVGATVRINGVDVPLNDAGGNPSVTVQFVAGPPDVTNPETKLVVVKGVATANGVSTDSVYAHLVDKNGHLIDYPVDISFFVTGGTAGGTAVLTGSGNNLTPVAGNLPLSITNTSVGTVLIGATVTYTIGGVTTTLTITNGSPANVQFVKEAPDVSNPETKLVVDDGVATADGVDHALIYAHLVNTDGQVMANKSVDKIEFFIIPSGGPEATAVLTVPGIAADGSIKTDINGNIYLEITNTKVGTVQLGARVTVNGVTQTITFGSPAPVKFVAGQAVPSAPGAPNGQGTMLTITKDFAQADGTSVDIVQAYITDKLGNPVPDTTVTFSIRTGGTATATAVLVGTVQVKTGPDGKAIMKITNTVAGTVWIDATIIYNADPAALIDGSYKEVTFTNFPDVTNPATRLIVIVYEALADGQSTTVVKAHIVDQNGDNLPGQEVKFTIDSGSAQIITPGPWITDANGDVSIEMTSTKPGSVLVTATVTVSGVDKAITFGSPARVKFAAINIYVPPVFTPNGDGTNDVLKPILVGISSFHYFNVYNRWGNLIFTTQDPNYGWDGRFKGVPQPVETYLWIAEGIDINGKKIVARGMTSLVK